MLFCVLLRHRLYLESFLYIALAPASKLCAKGTSKGPRFLTVAQYYNMPSILSTIHPILKTFSFLQMLGMLARQSRTFTRRMQRNLSRGAAYSLIRVCSCNWKLMPLVLDMVSFYLIVNIKTSILQFLSPFPHHHDAWLTDFCGYIYFYTPSIYIITCEYVFIYLFFQFVTRNYICYFWVSKCQFDCMYI
jgi:hypothetical protein